MCGQRYPDVASAAETPLSSRTSPSALSVMTVGMTSGRGDRRDQSARLRKHGLRCAPLCRLRASPMRYARRSAPPKASPQKNLSAAFLGVTRGVTPPPIMKYYLYASMAYSVMHVI